MQQLLLVSANQFGYAAGYYYYAKHLSKYYNISFLCFDDKKDKLEIEGVDVVYLKRINRYIDALNLLYNFISLNIKYKYNAIIFRYLQYSFIFRIFSYPRKFILDIRSATISENRIKREFGDVLIKFNSLFCKNIMTLSVGLKNKLKIGNAFIVPLGGERMSVEPKRYDDINLLYVGTLDNRHIDITIEGIVKFLKDNSKLSTLSYDIVGNGSEKNINRIIELINKYNLENIVKFHGYKNYEEIAKFYENNNIGVSFIPITIFYENQPPTKTYEYLVSGMPVIATKNRENISVIDDSNGILIADTADDFCDSLKKIKLQKEKWIYKTIIDNSSHFKWKTIINKILLPYIRQ